MTRPRRAIVRPVHGVATWWSGLQASERVLYRAVALSAIGFGLVYPPLAFIVPAALFGLVFFGFSFRRMP